MTPARRTDLEEILDHTNELWDELRGASFFITGGTGFIGCWLLETIKFANERLNVGVTATILTRNPTGFEEKVPHLARYSAFNLLHGDVCDFEYPHGRYTHLVHGATDASADLNERAPLQMFDTITVGTRRVLEFARIRQIGRVLFMSSGAVYGRQPPDMMNVREDWFGGPDPLDGRATYAEAKRAAELLCGIYNKKFEVNIVIARIFALLGPYLSLDIHFAAGNFIRDSIRGKSIVVKGDGRPVRSYLYATDLIVSLLRILVKADARSVYNVGSAHGISIRELAHKVSILLGNGDVTILGEPDKGWNAGRYVPDVTKIQRELRVSETVSIDESILRTAKWHGWAN
jgi:nucleoside-diphosphate-sugar epimerase